MVRVYVRTEAVKTYLARKSKSQNWLALRLRISSGHMSQLMTRARCPSPELRTKMLKQFGQDFDDWFEIETR